MEELASYQLVGEVKAYQGYDGYLDWEVGQTQGHWDTGSTSTDGSNQEYWAMGETLTQRRRVEDEGPRVVNSF